MGTIQSDIGLVTGLKISETVDALMKLAAKRRDMLSERTDTLKSEQLAVTELSALLLAIRYSSDALGKAALFDERQAASSNEGALGVKVTGTPNVGSYQFTPIRTVQTQQWLSGGFASDKTALGGGQITLRYGDNVQRSTPLEVFNGGAGVSRGKIRVTDRSGASAQIDLTAVQTVDDVLDAINGNTTINVTAVARGDGFRLIDNTGQAVSNLRVQEVAGGTTAASLGLADINAASAVADGQDVIRLGENVELDSLNDGNGVRIGDYNFADVLANLRYTLRDGTTADVKFYPTDATGGDDSLTLGNVIKVFNQIAPNKLRMEIADDGDRLVVRDLTEGEGAFSLSTIANRQSEVAEDLGIAGTSADGVITGRRLLGGSQSVLLSSLNGGSGVGRLGAVELTDRSGRSDTVDLSGAETLQQLIDALNAADVGILARVNQAKTGVELLDTTGKSAGNLIVADADGSGTAARLGLAVDEAASSFDTGDLHLQIISHNTKLADLNGGAGVARSFFTIIDGSGRQSTVDLRDSSIVTVGDLFEKIRQETQTYLTPEINATGDGIQLRDYANATVAPRIIEGDGTTAADLHLLDGAKRIKYQGKDVWVIDGSTTEVVNIAATDTLDQLRQKINALGVGVTANTFSDGSSKPFHLSLRSNRGGRLGALVIDASKAGFSLEETVEAKDALLVYGGMSSASTNVLVSSRTNTFSGVVTGLQLEVKQPSTSPVTVTVSRSDANVVSNVTKLVDTYNKFREKYNTATKYNAETNESGVLFGSAAALRMNHQMSSLASGRFLGLGSIQSLGQIGIAIKQDGTLSFDSEKLKTLFARDADTVRDFFVGTSTDVAPSDLGITIAGGWIRVDQEKLNEKYAEDPEAVIEYFGRGRGRYSMEEMGVTFKDGKVEVNQPLLQSRFTGDKQLAEALSVEKTEGVSAKFAKALESMAGLDDSSLLTSRFNTLVDKIARNEEKLAFYDTNLETERNRLTMQFYRMELAIGKLQANLTALGALSPVSPLTSTTSSSKS